MTPTPPPPPNNCSSGSDVFSNRLYSYADFYIRKISRDKTEFDLNNFLDTLEEINVRFNINCRTSKNVLEMYLIEKQDVLNNKYGSTKLIYSNLLNVNLKKASDLNKKKFSLNYLKRKNVVSDGVGDQSTCVKSMIKYLQKHKGDLADLRSFKIKNKATFEKRNDNPKNKPTRALVTMAAVTIKGIQYFFIMKMLNRMKLTTNSDTDNLLINFIKVNGMISQDVTNDKLYRLETSKIQYFLNYTDFNPNNPDASVNVNKVHIEEWITKYNLAKNPSADSNIVSYCPSAIVSYNNGQNRLNYICKIINITTDTNATNGETKLIFTFDTSKVHFTGKDGKQTENNPARTKIDTVFMEGTFNDIRIDFDPLYDPKYKYNADFSYFLQGDLTIHKTKNNKFLASLPMETKFIGYRNWNPNKTSEYRNNILEVWCDDINYMTKMMPRDRDSTIAFTPSTTIEYSNGGVTSTNIVQINDSHISKHTDDSHRVFFELDNKIVKFFNNKNGYKSVSKTLKEGIYYDVRMDIDSGVCGTMPGLTGPRACWENPCWYQVLCSSRGCACCFNDAHGCPNSYCQGAFLGNCY
jgi:hypothetical protein